MRTTLTSRGSAAAGLALAGVLLLAACGSSSGGSRSAAPTVAPATTTAAPAPSAAVSTPATTPAAQPRTGCAPTAGGGVPAGAVSKVTRDVDGDGRSDTLWVTAAAGTQTVGITTASGATFTHDASSAAPVGPAAVVVDPTGTGAPLDVLVSHRLLDVLTISGCSLATVTDKESHPYQFGMGWTSFGTGMGCSTVGGKTGLVGLNAVKQADGSFTISRTAVLQTGTHAVNGPTDTVRAAAGSAAAASAMAVVSCHDVTLAKDGVALGS